MDSDSDSGSEDAAPATFFTFDDEAPQGGGDPPPRGPLWVLPASAAVAASAAGGHAGTAVLAKVLVETFGPAGEAAVALCGLCAEPVDRCGSIHTYLMTKPSLRRHPKGVRHVVEELERLTQGRLPQKVKRLLLGELAQPRGVVLVVGQRCAVESSSREELVALQALTAVADVSSSGIEWRPAATRQDPDAVAGVRPFWRDIDSWQKNKIDASREAALASAEHSGSKRPRDTPTPPPPTKRQKLADVVPPQPPAPTQPLPDNVLVLSDDESLFSFEGEADEAPPTLSPPPAAEADPAAAAPAVPSGPAAAALIAVAACHAALRSVTGVYAFCVADEKGVEAVRRSAREANIRCWLEWDLTEVLAEGTYDGPGPRFVPRTPRWTLSAVRAHQEAALDAAFPCYDTGARMKSGVVALPCGAGKTMVGVLASAAVRAPCLVLCTSGIAVEQWVSQYSRWAELHAVEGRVARYTGKVKDKVDDASQIVVTTYNMLMPRKRSEEGSNAVARLLKKHWGLVVLDEVHVLPADSCSTVIKNLYARGFLGLTATLVREDKKIMNLDHLIGPKLFEADWSQLVSVGVLARVRCIEVQCVLTEEFATEYMATDKASLREYLGCLNPTKLQATAEIVKHHEAIGNKALVFSDSLFVLKQLHFLLQRPVLSGATPLRERLQLLSDFQSGTRLNTLLVSRIGDCAIDLPEASVIIQVSSHFGSRRQEAQRLGRILRPKGAAIRAVPFVKQPPPLEADFPNALFYTMVSLDTAETMYSHRRHLFLEEQGYAYQQVRYHTPAAPLVMETRRAQVDLLAKVLSVWQVHRGRQDEAERRNVASELQTECAAERSPSPERVFQRATKGLAALSRPTGTDALVYGEWNLGGLGGP
eukprot:TRINITY_DN28376_c0_g1_i1.p1 TRINITY_DN28376_c0_g1~~TRINITY_DN28376_c0_g1_i1.p1  ORF type:complete len:901 (+),score=286.71 TRINITY_DN28376_c0_g1_i1:76-2703(+)